MGYTQADIFGAALSFPVVGFMLTGVRFWMRRYFQKMHLGADDWLILFASVLVVGMAINMILGSYFGLMGMDGRPIIESHQTAQSKIDYAMLVFEKPAYGAIKLSVLFFYRRIFTLGMYRTITNWLIGVVIAWTLTFFLGDILNCGTHPQANWNPELKARVHCDNLYAFLLVFAVTDVVTSMAILWIPYPQIRKLYMDPKERWALAGVFLLGSLDLIIGLVRMSFIIANETIPAVESGFNPPESTAPTFYTVVEVGVGVIAANLPALAPLFKQRAKLMSSLSSMGKKLLSLSGISASRNDSVWVLPQKDMRTAYHENVAQQNGPNVRHPDTAQHQRSASVGMWDQFERIENMSAEELELDQRRQTSSNTLV